MFKAKLIDNQLYPQLKRKQWLLILLLLLLTGFMVSSYDLPLWIAISVVGLYLLVHYYLFRYQRSLQALVDNRVMMVNKDEISIIDKTENTIVEVIKLETIDRLVLKETYPPTGEASQNFLSIHQGGQHRRFDFEIDSFFMADQLEKTIAQWYTEGYQIERQ